MNPVNDKNEAKCQEEGSTDSNNNDCCNCKEGCVLGENVYCSIDGRFHPFRERLVCRSFIRKEK